jgi:hypothetical protein
MTEGNWVGGPNVWLNLPADWVSEKKDMAESMRCDRKIGEGIIPDQNRKEKRNKNRTGFFC